MLKNTINHLQQGKKENQKKLLINQKLLKTQILLIQNQLLQDI